MGIKLDWQVESEQSHLHATEDPEARYRRQQARRRVILVVFVLGSVAALVAALVVWRLERVDDQYRQDLLDTVEIEVTALRLGDFANYLAIQRSASESFLLEQSREFERYQELKRANRIELTGTVIAATIDKTRGRVIVEEIIDGIPYHVVWFYWYYEEAGERDQGGWRHVPDDLTFWGDPGEISADGVRITYHDLDRPFAEALAPRIAEWWARGCQMVGCAGAPSSLRVDIVVERPAVVEWAAYESWTLRITSPLVDRARADVVVNPALEQTIVAQIAARLVGRVSDGAPPVTSHTDAAWLESDLVRWLARQLASGADTAGSGFVESLSTQYGPGVPAALLAALNPDATLDSALTAVTGVSMPLLSVDQLAALDWRGFFQWRLALEFRLLADPSNRSLVLLLYDMDNVYVSGEAALRLEDPAYAARPVPQVQAVNIARDEQSQTYAYVTVTGTESGLPDSSAVIYWRLAGGTWKRAS